MHVQKGAIEEDGTPTEVFGNTRSQRLRQFIKGHNN